MHEMRTTPSPLNNEVVSERAVSFMWPLEADNQDISTGLDGMESKKKRVDKNKISYQIRYSQDSELKKDLQLVTTKWPFYNPSDDLAAGEWYWQYGYVKNGVTNWSDTLWFTVKNNPEKFTPPSYKTLISKLPTTHPRVWVEKDNWDTFIKDSHNKPERKWYLSDAKPVLDYKIEHFDDLLNTRNAHEIEDKVKRNSLLVRESRRVIDKEEKNVEALIRAYLLTKEERYFLASMKRIKEVLSWKDSENMKGDFNPSVLLSLSSMAYDSFYDLLSNEDKAMLLNEIKDIGTQFYNRFNNNLENHIADNHTWQMTLRIFTMAAFASYGDLPEADLWTEYAYNLWLARFPGLNNDGGWHNGDSYFHVNIKTLIEVPYFYSRVTGFDFFTDPWYQGNAMYVIFQQPPFSKSGGNGSSHQTILTPSGTRVAYADALAKLTNNSYAADYVRTIEKAEPNILKSGFLSKSGDLSWFRLQCDKPLPKGGKGLTDLPSGYVFPNSGLASLMSRWDDISKNTMLSFRSSPYGSTSHALANQNAYNIFYGGQPIFYSSGHHISFTDEHSIYSHRATRAHNSILVDGMGQRIGTEGYGWIPRHYIGNRVSYIVGDASNAYGNVISPLWLKRGEASGLEYSPENGWDENRLKTFRRHIVELGNTDLVFIYDELEADSPVSWSYLLHSVKDKMEISENKTHVVITGRNKKGISNAHLFSSDKLVTDQTNDFFYPAINWKRADSNGVFQPYDNHWHFTAKSGKHSTYRFATIIDTHNKKTKSVAVKFESGKIICGDWLIDANLSTKGKAYFLIENKKENISINYDDATRIVEGGKVVLLEDKLPELEI